MSSPTKSNGAAADLLQTDSELRGTAIMRNQLGFFLQFAALVFLPLLIIWQLNFKFELLWMPLLTLASVVVFWVGHRLREPEK